MSVEVRNAWSDNEVYALLEVWGDRSIMDKMDGTSRNSLIFKEIVSQMAERGYTRTVAQVKNKMKNLKKDYRKFVDHNNRSGMERRTMKFSDELERILGDRPSANPVTLVESSGGCDGLEADDFAQDECLSQVSSIDEEDADEYQDTWEDDSEEQNTPVGDSAENSEVLNTSCGGSPQDESVPSSSSSSSKGKAKQRKRPSARETPSQSKKPKQSDMLHQLEKMQAKGEDRFWQEWKKSQREQAERDEKWQKQSVEREEKFMESMTSFMSTMTRMMEANMHQPHPPSQPMNWPRTHHNQGHSSRTVAQNARVPIHNPRAPYTSSLGFQNQQPQWFHGTNLPQSERDSQHMRPWEEGHGKQYAQL